MTDISTNDLIELWNSMAYYSEEVWDTKIEYICTPWQPWLSVDQSWWKIMRITREKDTLELTQGKCIMYAWGSPSLSHKAENLDYVKSLEYS